MIAACIAAVLSLPLVAQAQGIVRGAEEGAAEGNRAAGPVGAWSAVPLAASSVALRECSEFRNEAVYPLLIAFYNSLDDRQKAKFDRFRERRGRE